jgi:hypothetical protein
MARTMILTGALALAALSTPVRLAAQDNTLDLRFLELDSKGHVTYQNFIYSRMLDSTRWMVQALFLKLPEAGNYNEYAAGVGYRFATIGSVSSYVIAGAGTTNNSGSYFEPALFFSSTAGKLTGDAFVQRYVAVTNDATSGWLLDPLELNYAVASPFAVGAALYAYQPVGGVWFTKLGGKLGLNDKLGTSEIRISHVSTGGAEFQFRRIFVF